MTHFGALTEDSQHFSWEGMMRCMTVGLWPSGIFSFYYFVHLLLVSNSMLADEKRQVQKK